MSNELIYALSEKYEEYLIDESKMQGFAETISFPESEEDIISILQSLGSNAHITIQGGKTGIVGGAVPLGGHIMNVSRMNKVISHQLLEDGSGLITVEAGINLIDLKKEINSLFKQNPVFWPSEPTETSATVGGVAACNANGLCAPLYGDSKQYIVSTRIVLADGSVKSIPRDDSGLLDAVLASEGILGVFTQLTLKLIPKPAEMWGITFFFDEKLDCANFVDDIKNNMPTAENAAIAAVEYFDRNTITMIENRKSVMSKLKDFPDISTAFQAMLYFELHGEEDGIEVLAENLMETAINYNSDPEQAWAVSGEMEIEKMRAFRHAAPETANLLIEEARKTDKEIFKLGADMCLEEQSFASVLLQYEHALENSNIPYCIFGHALGNHLHVNILPENKKQFDIGKEIMRNLAIQFEQNGGKIISEHGLGKLKKSLFQGIITGKYKQDLIERKKEFDPDGIFGYRNVF